MIDSKVDLFLENHKDLRKINGSWGMYELQLKSNALTCTVKNQRIDIERINLALDIIKKSTGVFSNFRGINKLTTAITISFENNMEESLNKIIDIYNKLKEKFHSSEYLVIAAQVLFNARNRVNVEAAVKRTKEAYDYMKQQHKYLTGQEDIANAAIIATTSDNLQETFKDIEESYEYLLKNKFASRNNIQGLSQILSLINMNSMEKCDQVLKVNSLLKEKNASIKDYYVPMLGIIAFLGNNKETFTDDIAELSHQLKKEKGFGNFSMGSNFRNMISATLVSMDYIDSLDSTLRENIINNTNNIALTVAIAVQTAVLVSSVAAASAASAASSSS